MEAQCSDTYIRQPASMSQRLKRVFLNSLTCFHPSTLLFVKVHNNNNNIERLRPDVAMWRHSSGSSSVQVMTCRMFGAKLSAGLMLIKPYTIGNFLSKCKFFLQFYHHQWNIVVWNLSNTAHISSALWILIVYIATMESTHPCVFSCLWVNVNWNLRNKLHWSDPNSPLCMIYMYFKPWLSVVMIRCLVTFDNSFSSNVALSNNVKEWCAF